MSLTKCRKCNEIIKPNFLACPHCKCNLPNSSHYGIVMFLVVIFWCGAIVLGYFGVKDLVTGVASHYEDTSPVVDDYDITITDYGVSITPRYKRKRKADFDPNDILLKMPD